MRRSIVEGEDYSVLPMPVVRMMSWLRNLGHKPEPAADGTDSESDEPAS